MSPLGAAFSLVLLAALGLVAWCLWGARRWTWEGPAPEGTAEDLAAMAPVFPRQRGGRIIFHRELLPSGDGWEAGRVLRGGRRPILRVYAPEGRPLHLTATGHERAHLKTRSPEHTPEHAALTARADAAAEASWAARRAAVS